MQKFKRKQDLGGVKPCPVHFESPRLLNVEHEVAAVQVLHYEEEVGLKRDTSQRSNGNGPFGRELHLSLTVV